MLCQLCRNISTDDDLVAADATGYLRSIREDDVSQFDLLTDEDVWKRFDILAESRPHLSNDDFEKLEQSMGMNYVEGSILADKELRPHFRYVEACRIDPMHTYFQGIFEDEMYKFIEFCKDILGNTWSSLQSFCSQEWKWQWPVGTRSKGRAISEIFNDTRKKSSTRAKNFKCGDSEALTCFPLARRWAELHLQDLCVGSPELL